MILYAVYNIITHYSNSRHKGYLDIKYDTLVIIIYNWYIFSTPNVNAFTFNIIIVPIYNDIIWFYFLYILYLYNVNLEKSSQSSQ